MKQARIGIVGAGFWATTFYLPFLARHPEACCVGIVRREETGLAELRRAFDLEVATTSEAELIAQGCDGMIVASSHAVHRQHAEQALNAGMHVLVEKPMTVTLDDARALAAAARRSGTSLSVAHGWNYSRLACWAADVVARGAIGPIVSITGYMASALVELFSGTAGYGKVAVEGFEIEAESATWATVGAGGGYLYGQLSHQLGLALLLLSAAPRSVFARMDRLLNGVDIDVTVSVQFDGGAIASFSGTGRLPWGTRYPMELRIVGQRGVLTLDFGRDQADVFYVRDTDKQDFTMNEGEYAFAGRAPDERLEVRPGEGIYTCDGPPQFLIDCCLGRETPNRAPAELGVRAVAIMEAAEQSDRAGCPIDL
jgi:predicted dehydrogenase